MKRQNSGSEKIAVIGAGIIGITAAYRLQQAGYQVTLYDKEGIAQGCSKGNAGHFATEQVFPLAQKALIPQIPKMLLDPLGPFSITPNYFHKAIPWFLKFLSNMRSNKFNANKAALKSINKIAIDSWLTLITETDLGELFHQKGSLLTFESESNSIALKIMKAYQAEGVIVKLLNKKEVNKLEPGISNSITWALHFTAVAHTCCPETLTREIYKKSKSLGVKFIQTEITHIESNANQINITSKNQTFHADKLLLAAGAHSKIFCKQLGFKVPLDTERGYHYMVESNTPPTRPIVSFERKFIMTPMRDGLRLAGTVEFAGLEKGMNPKRANALLPSGHAIWPKITKHKSENCRWMGFRPSLPDSKPVIGQSPVHNNIYFSFGHQHLGLTLAATNAELITECMLNKKTSISLAPFSIDRF
ncbi:NAD(P)/FAD-dependent oxidoreductase [Pseudoalteromonas denitrificans]|uniref:D-amino-acid dehydrogenase n=1 Tax=Pseudoalteromonas denitrificans DSM 6059 TaxID=1123010 RepID=A0A1I1EI37_9GAMM|nr:FAD-dependent oxidoreductase [Pseudoalteromonas denitrificans]SFB86721.1 D-amino-acid dehydrogenase [Pseudoalteromonas denitrificans DSM 6059]